MHKEAVEQTWESYWHQKRMFSKSPYSSYYFGSHLSHFADWFDLENRKVLEVGVGEGTLLLEVADVADAFGVDISESAIQLTKSLFNRFDKTCKIVRSDAFNIGFKDGTFDLVYCLGLVEHFKEKSDKEKIIAELCRVTRPSGHVVMTVPKKWSVYTPKRFINRLLGNWKFGYEEEFSVSRLEDLVSPFFKELEFVGIDIYPSLLNLVPSRGPKRWLDRELLIPALQRIERKHPQFAIKVGHMLCVKGSK